MEAFEVNKTIGAVLSALLVVFASKTMLDIAYKEHPRSGYIGLQDHGSPCWFKNIKIKPLK